MFGIGTPELIVIFIVALLVLGPKRLPEVARTLGRTLAELRKATSGMAEELNNARVILEEESRAIHRMTTAKTDTKPAGPDTAPEPPPSSSQEASDADPSVAGTRSKDGAA